jgi:putative SOS response-associated peptidase YedK
VGTRSGYTLGMCGRYALAQSEAMQLRLGVDLDGLDEWSETRVPPPTEPRFNIAPAQIIPVVVERPERRVLVPMRWGFKPKWLKGPKRPAPINARAETLLERPMFRTAVPRHRCLVPATGYYEWQAVPGEKRKRPWFYRLRDGALFCFAGLYAESEDGPSCAIITTRANELAARVHERMPVILTPEDEALWLDPEVTDPAAVLGCLGPYRDELMTAYPVSTLVSSVGNQGPELIRPIERT